MNPSATGAPGRRWRRIAVLAGILVTSPAGIPGADLPAAEPREGDLAALQEQLRAGTGHPILVNFWATWCLPCLKEIPVLNELQDQLAGEGVRFLAVSLDSFVYPDEGEARERVRRVMAETSFALPVFLYVGDQDPFFAAFALPPGLPQTLLLGPEGEVLDRVEGQLEPAEVERLVEKVRDSLAD